MAVATHRWISHCACTCLQYLQHIAQKAHTDCTAQKAHTDCTTQKAHTDCTAQKTHTDGTAQKTHTDGTAHTAHLAPLVLLQALPLYTRWPVWCWSCWSIPRTSGPSRFTTWSLRYRQHLDIQVPVCTVYWWTKVINNKAIKATLTCTGTYPRVHGQAGLGHNSM